MIYILITVSVFSLDFVIKHYIDKHKELNKPEMIAGNRLILRKYYNEGAALNFMAKTPELLRIVHGIILGLVVFVYGLALGGKGNRSLKTGLSILIGGGASNLLDRYTKKHVVDYFSFPVKWKWFRGIIFNLSDMFVFLGAVLVALGGRKR